MSKKSGFGAVVVLCVYTAAGNSYCTNAGQDAELLVQNNIYAGVNNPLQVSRMAA